MWHFFRKWDIVGPLLGSFRRVTSVPAQYAGCGNVLFQGKTLGFQDLRLLG